jgi:hypothetical protein
LVVLAVIGCGGDKNVGQVSGTVTYQGKPLPIGTVSFLDSSNHALASSAINNGAYATPGKVPVGPIKAIVTTPSSSSGGRRPTVVRNNKRVEKIRVIPIPAKYGSADSSGLGYTVKPGANTYNIELE